MMKLACIYNVWDGAELLAGSMNCRGHNVDLFIIVWQEKSNYGELYNPLIDFDLNEMAKRFEIRLVQYFPDLTVSGTQNEIRKRNLGLKIAKEESCTHFLFSDCDEYFENFGLAKSMYRMQHAFTGSVCKMLTYFKRPTLRLENPDNYYVPFIHQLKPDSVAGVREYPFYVDPTRRVNEKNVIEIPVLMHHFSWVRKDILRKVRNSSARNNLMKNHLVQDYFDSNVKAGSTLVDYQGQRLVDCENIFNISLPPEETPQDNLIRFQRII